MARKKQEVKENIENTDQVKKFIDDLKVKDVPLRLAAVKGLREFACPTSVEPLIDLLKNCLHFNSRRETAIEIIHTLGAIPTPESLAGITLALDKSTHYQLQKSVIEVLGLYKFSNATTLLTNIAMDQKQTMDIRIKCVESLIDHGKMDFIRNLFKVYYSANINAEESLKDLALSRILADKDRCLEILRKDLDGKNENRKKVAMMLIGELGEGSFLDRLKLFIKDTPGSELAKLAAETIILVRLLQFEKGEN